MPATKSPRPKLQFHPHAYFFVKDALSEAQSLYGRDKHNEAGGHITPRELLNGVRILGQRRFGMMGTVVFRCWGIHTTADVGRIVFELIERGDMKKTEDDQFSDFCEVFSFETAFAAEYVIDTSKAFRS